MTTRADERLRAREVIARFDFGRSLRLEAVDPIPTCGCRIPLRSGAGCARCGGRARRGPWARWGR